MHVTGKRLQGTVLSLGPGGWCPLGRKGANHEPFRGGRPRVFVEKQALSKI